MSDTFRAMCLELADNPEKLAAFVRLYYDGSEPVPHVCPICKDDIADKTVKFCSSSCQIFHNIYINGTLAQLEQHLKAYNTDDHAKTIGKAEQLKFTQYYEDMEYTGISQEKLIMLVKSPSHIAAYWVRCMTKSGMYDAILLEHLSIEMFEYVAENGKKHQVEPLITKFSLQELYKRDLITSLFRSHSYKELLKTVIQFEDIPKYNYEWMFHHFLQTLGREECVNRNIYKYCYNKRIYDLFYDSVDEEHVWESIQKSHYPEFIMGHKMSNPNKLFCYYTRDKLVSNGMYYSFSVCTNRLFNERAGQFLYNQTQLMKKGDITMDTLMSFFKNCYEYTPHYLRILYSMLCLFDPGQLPYTEVAVDYTNKEIPLVNVIFRTEQKMQTIQKYVIFNKPELLTSEHLLPLFEYIIKAQKKKEFWPALTLYLEWVNHLKTAHNALFLETKVLSGSTGFDALLTN